MKVECKVFLLVSCHSWGLAWWLLGWWWSWCPTTNHVGDDGPAQV